MPRSTYLMCLLGLLPCLTLVALYYFNPPTQDPPAQEWRPLPYTKRECPPSPPGDPDTVIYIPSPIAWRERRTRVLRKMRRELGNSTHVYIVFGTRSGSRLEREASDLNLARQEAEREADPRIRYLFTECRDTGDEYNNANGTSSTTCKTYQAIRHIAKAYTASPPRFVWRGADDAYLNLNVFREHVAPKLQTCRLFFGALNFPSPHDRQDLVLDTTQPNLYALFGLKKFGKYMYGMGFLMSWDVVQLIGLAQIPPRLVAPEDVVVSQWLLFHDVDWTDIMDVAPETAMENVDHPEWRKQYTHLLVAHKISPAQWDALETGELL